MAGYLPLLVMMVLAAVFAAGAFVTSRLLGPSAPNAAKEGPYESGIVPTREPAQRFPVRFYLVAMIFIIFDIEIIFTYPWAVIYSHDLGTYGLVEMVVFAVAVFVSFLYLISNGALDWGPVSRVVSQVRLPPERTTTSTVRRVHKSPSEEAAWAGAARSTSGSPEAIEESSLSGGH